MNPTLAFCPNLACPARGQAGKGNISMHSRKEKRLLCRQYGKTFTDVIPAERHKAITKYARKTNRIERFQEHLAAARLSPSPRNAVVLQETGLSHRCP